MSGSESDDGPVFVDDSGTRRRLAALIATVVAVVALALTATLGWAVFANAPVSVASESSTTSKPTAVIGRAAAPPSRNTSGSGGPFAVATSEPAPSADPSSVCRVVRGTVFNDVDLNGSRQPASEKPVAGVVVELTDSFGRVAATTTDTQGRYSLRVEAPGPSRLEFRGRLEEFVPTPVGADVAPWVTFPTGASTCVVDTSAMWTGWFEGSDVTAANVTREIGDRVWLDLDGDGVQDPAEPGIPGVDLALLDDTGRRVASTTTSAAGTYRFSGLDASTPYRIVLANTTPYGPGALEGVEPTTPWAGTTFDGTSVVSQPGATGRDSGHLRDEHGAVYVAVDPDEVGASDHSFDLGFRPVEARPAD
ncbi:MAG: MSCRAMM family adhesin SdrC [Actinomycetota bacterium]|nr:MSCRAMM family adhesin SdrC [Actinomycetota bacterium]